jgi:hypothetical protein
MPFMFKSTSTSFGLFSIIYGVSEIVMGVEVRRTGHTVGEVLEHAA